MFVGTVGGEGDAAVPIRGRNAFLFCKYVTSIPNSDFLCQSISAYRLLNNDRHSTTSVNRFWVFITIDVFIRIQISRISISQTKVWSDDVFIRIQVRIGNPFRYGPMMGNVNEGKGLFAPVVVVTRNIVGKKRFNQLRGKAIALHSQVITEFCKSIGADSKHGINSLYSLKYVNNIS
ncbi:hypothetical protein LXL04_038547 [Taraxacum kok-saghyz]